MARAKPTYNNVVATLCLVCVATGSAVAANGDGGGPTSGDAQAARSVSACVVKKGKRKGQMRMLQGKQRRCKRTERKVTWNQRGVQGVAGAEGVAPTGAVNFFALASCPAGWSPFADAQGRYIVGLPQGGVLAKATGTPLTDGEDRAAGQHTHGVTDPGHAHTAVVDPILVGGNVAAIRFQGTADDGTGFVQQTLSTDAAPTNLTVNPFGTVAGTNAPYVQLLACRKD
jgi:hypothetical protein